MGSVTGFTAEYQQEIMDSTIVDGEVVGGHLILKRHDNATIDAGPVIGPAGPTGAAGEITEAEMDAAILADQNATGKGIVGHVSLTSYESWALAANVYQDITGASITFTPVVGHYYRFSVNVPMESWEADTYFELLLRNTGGSDLMKVTNWSPIANRVASLNGQRVMVAPSGWNVAKTFKLAVRSSSAFEFRMQGSSYPMSFTIEDLGTNH